MRRALPPAAAAAALALALAPPAAAHVVLAPERVAPGSEPVLAFALPNEGASAVVRVDVTVPEGVAVGPVEARPGWRVERAGRRLSWIGSLAPGRLATFSVAAAVEGPGTRVFRVREQHADGRVERWRPALEVAAPAGGRDAGARTLARVALGVAIAAALLAAGGGFLALWLWLRGSGD